MVLAALVFVLASAQLAALKHRPDPPPREQAITLSILRLPEPGFKPRLFDPRSNFGAFSTLDFSTPFSEPLEKRVVGRFRLEKKDPMAAVSEAVKPIVYYVDRGIPEPIRTAVLEGAGYQVDVVSGEAVDVEAYRSLPERGYGLLVLRVHSARVEGPTGLTDDVALFTGEMIDLAAYNLSEVSPGAATAVAGELERLAASGTPRTARAKFSDAELAALIPVTYSSRGVELPWFGLRPEFVRDHLRGVPPKDVDIATSATPDAVRALFARVIPVGEDFGVVLVLDDYHVRRSTSMAVRQPLINFIRTQVGPMDLLGVMWLQRRMKLPQISSRGADDDSYFA